MAATTSRVSPQRLNSRFEVTITVPVSYRDAINWNNAAEAVTNGR